MTRRSTRLLGSAALLCSLAASAALAAQEPAIDLGAEYEAAARRAARNDISGAIRGFKLVVEQDPFWSDAVYNIAALSEHLGAATDCALYFRRYLQLDPTTDEAGAIRDRIAACEGDIPHGGTVRVASTTPEGATIAIDGLVLGTGQLEPIVLPAGTYTITAEKRDWLPFSAEISVASGQELSVDVVLQPVIYYGAVRIEVLQTGATVSVDGVDAGTAPLAEPLRLAAGTYLIEVRAPGYHPWRRAVEVRRDDDQVHRVELIDERVDLDSL